MLNDVGKNVCVRNEVGGLGASKHPSLARSLSKEVWVCSCVVCLCGSVRPQGYICVVYGMCVLCVFSSHSI